MSGKIEQNEQKFPVHEVIKVIRGVNIYKSEKWWKAALLTENYGKRQVAVYQWIKKESQWKRKQKMSIASKDEWGKIVEACANLVAEL
jgi:hypothetical protein